MATALLIEFFNELPQLQQSDDPDLWAARMHDSLRKYRAHINATYTEGTLQRLLHSADTTTRKAAILGLGLIGTMESNSALAHKLQDEDRATARMASDALWQLWFRGGTDAQNAELQRILHLPDFLEIIAGLDDLVRESPLFAEVYNQRAIMYFQRGEFDRSAKDCETVLLLNPYHFGAQAGLGKCLMKMNKPKAAIRAFRHALQINPTLTHLNDTIELLETSSGN